MSGIAGFVNLDGRPAGRERLERMAAAASFFSPDEIGTWIQESAALMHAKLATTTEAAAGKQPAVDGEWSLCFDGRLDNREQLLVQLRNVRPCDARAPDAEIVLALYEIKGDSFLADLVGDYALALWNSRRRRLFCARSVLGWRPFLWHCDGIRFSFASQPRVLLAGSDIPRRINEPVLAEILSLRFASPDETLWKGIYRLPPGSAMVVEGTAPRVWQWYKGPFPEIELPSEDAYADAFRKLFDQSLSACLRSSSGVAAHLSGGLDSSSITCRAAELARSGSVPTMVQPVSAVFPGEPHDESRYVRAVEAHQRITTRQIISKPYDWDWARTWSADSYHLPLRPNTAGTWIATCERLRAEGFKVLLTGEGGDDWLTGSLSHWPDLLRRARLLQLWHEGRFLQAGRPLWRTIASIGKHGIGPWISPRLRLAIRHPNLRLHHPLPPWIRCEWALRNGLAELKPRRDAAWRLPTFAQQQRSARYIFARPYVNVENVLAFAASRRIEARHPFHDRRLTEFVVGLPGHLLRNGKTSKYLLRQAMKGTLPEEVRTRTDKARFDAPIHAALESILAETPLHKLTPVREGWIHEDELARELQHYRAGISEPGTTSTGNIMPVWFAASLDVWMKYAVS